MVDIGSAEQLLQSPLEGNTSVISPPSYNWEKRASLEWNARYKAAEKMLQDDNPDTLRGSQWLTSERRKAMHQHYLKDIMVITEPLRRLTQTALWNDPTIDVGHDVLGLLGKNPQGENRTFTCTKFRSMIPDAQIQESEMINNLAKKYPDAGIKSLADAKRFMSEHDIADPRITTLGKTLRALNIDELPQLKDVENGDLSLVGFRPPSKTDAQHIIDMLERHKELPNDPYLQNYEIIAQAMKQSTFQFGVVGMYSLFGRESLNIDQRMQLEAMYLTHASKTVDKKILDQTKQYLIGSVMNKITSKFKRNKNGMYVPQQQGIAIPANAQELIGVIH
jgi:lipopolysaccharide/colanic/teichoic acid biosynthesis glycosyltransferase